MGNFLNIACDKFCLNFRNGEYLFFLQNNCIVLTMICISYRINLNISLNRILLSFLYYFHYLLPVLFFFIIFSFYFGMSCLLFWILKNCQKPSSAFCLYSFGIARFILISTFCSPRNKLGNGLRRLKFPPPFDPSSSSSGILSGDQTVTIHHLILAHNSRW